MAKRRFTAEEAALQIIESDDSDPADDSADDLYQAGDASDTTSSASSDEDQPVQRPPPVRQGRGRARGRAAVPRPQRQAQPAPAPHPPAAGDEQNSWTRNQHDPPVFLFQEQAGIQVPVPGDAKPSFFLNLFLTDEFWQKMVEETNRYATQEINRNRPLRRNSRLNAWHPTTVEEMKVFLGLLLQMGPVNLPTLEHYWREENLYKTTLWRDKMSRNRFQNILRFWHFNNNELPAHGRLDKIDVLLKHLNETMQRIYVPYESLSIDESMVLWRGRLVFRQYIKNKRHKYGIKLYELAESSGIIQNVTIYSGESFPDPNELGQTGAVVVLLMENYLGKGYSLYTDNFYNSVKLTEFMSSHSTYITGTLRADRRGNPAEVTKKQLSKGQCDSMHKGTTVVCKWKDKRDVLTISNKHKVEMVEVQNRKGQKKMKPNVIRDYNLGMSGIDNCDQMLSYYSGLRKTLRWYKKMGLHLIELFIHNAHKLHNQTFPGNKKRLLHFRDECVKGLIGLPLNRQQPRPQPQARFHYLEPIPATEKKEFPTKRCTMCISRNFRKESRYACAICEKKPALCVSPCFHDYHAANQEEEMDVN